MGSEGTFGIVTAVTLSVRWKPEKQDYTAFYMVEMEKGFELQRNIIQHGWEPPVMRQYDASEVLRLFPDHARDNDCLLIMVHEGPAGKVDAEIRECREIAADLGCDPADASVVEKWLEDRNHVPTFEEYLVQGVILDTIEIAATWDKISGIYKSAIASLNEVENIGNASAHSSHCYRSGINLYFTFAAIPSDSTKMSEVYYDCWRRVIEATLKKEIRNGKVNILDGDFDTHALQNEAFDKVCSVNTIYFWPDPETTAQKILNILKPGGFVVIAMEDIEQLKKRNLNEEIFNLYTTRDVTDLLSKSGFEADIDVISSTRGKLKFHCVVAKKRQGEKG